MDKKRQKTKHGEAENRRSKRNEPETPMEVDPVVETGEENEENFREIRIEDLADIENLVIPPPPEPPMNFDGTGPRLLITKIVNENFKSYAGRQTIGPFHKNFTSIVGPNGSGKSNVIDSILFVFGYRAQKIRSKKISVLIHNSDNYPDLDSCTVEVHFVKGIDKSNDEYEVVPDSAFIVSRTGFKDNSSEYRLNGKRIQFKDLSIILRRQGIDLDHNRFLILQGEVEQIALMKPKALQEGDDGMLEYLEDIVGSSRLVPIIEQLNKKLDEIGEVRNEKLNRVKAVESEKQDLEGPKNEAVEFMLLENSIIKKKFTLFNVHRLEAFDNCDTVAKERDSIKEEYQEHQTSLDDVVNTIKGKKQGYEDAKGKLEECSSKIEKFKERFRAMENEDTKLRGDLGHQKKKLKELPGQIDSEKKKLNELKAQPGRAEKQVEEMNEKVVQLEGKKPGLEKKLQEATSKLRDETKGLQTSKEKAEKELVQYQKNVNDARSKVDLARSELEICLSAQKNETKKLDDLKNSLKNISETLPTRKKNLPISEEQLKKVTKNFESTQRQLRETTVELTNCEEDVRNNRAKVDEARSKMQNSHSRGRVLDAIMTQKREGKIQGIIGRLGDLGAIDEKYDVAISTACGPLDNIVVDTIDTAQRCVEFLKRGNIGQATFLALDKQAHLVEVLRRPFESPENVPRLFDLIRVEDEDVLPAFYYALGNTLVAKDLDQATRIGLQGRTRNRVVTLDGKLVDTSGTMSGGGNQQMRGRMGRNVLTSPAVQISPDQMQRLDDQLKDKLNRLNELRKQKVDMEHNLQNYARESTRLQSEIDKLRIDIETTTEQETSLKKQIENQELVVERTVPDAVEQHRLETNVEKFQKEFDKVNAEPTKLQKTIDNFHKQIMEIHEKTVGSVQKQLDACQRELEDCRKTITKSTVSIKSSARNVAKTEEKIKNLEEELGEHEKLSQKIRDRLKELENEAMAITDEHNLAEGEVQGLEEACKSLKLEFDELERKEQELMKAGMDKKQRLDHVEKTLKEFGQKKNYWEKEIKKLKLNDLSDLKPLVDEQPSGDSTDDDDEQEEMDVGPQKLNDDRFDYVELTPPDEEELRKIDKQALITKVTMAEDQLKSMKPNISAIAEYRKKMEKFKECARQLDEVTTIRDRIRQKHDELKKRRLTEFLTGFASIATNLKEMYQMITLGGDADLELVDTMDPFSEGIAFSVRPPKKSWKQISNLSGGEKTLSSLALVFALHHYKPTPLYVMDEIDAALDFRNVSIVANYIKERTKNAQFIIISLRNNMFELSDRLIGIYKTYNCTKSVTVDPAKISMPAYPTTNDVGDVQTQCAASLVK